MRRIKHTCWSIMFASLTAYGAGEGGVSGCGGGEPPQPIPLVSADLASFVTSTLSYVPSYSEGYSIPAIEDLTAFDALIANLVDGEYDLVQSAAGALNLELVRFVDTGAGDNELHCLREVELLGRGFFCVDSDSSAMHHISVPHPLYDSNTNTQSITVMRDTGARFLSISTTHRCANAASSACSGTTSACGGGPFKVSDAAHNIDSYFHRFGVVVHDQSATTHTIQLHGCGSTSCPANMDNGDIVARLSAGTKTDLPVDELVNVLNTELNGELAGLQLGTSLSCSEPSPDKKLCGTTNPLGRYINGQPDPCRNAAAAFTNSRWLHIEQSDNLRVDDGAGDEVTPGTIATAINNAMGSP